MSNFIIQGYANLENVNANNMDLFYATMTEQLNTYFPLLFSSKGSINNGIGDIRNNFGQVGTGNTFNFVTGSIRFVDQITNLTTDVSIKPAFANYVGSSVTITCPISATQHYAVAVLGYNSPTDPYTTSTNLTISTTSMTLADIAGQTFPNRYCPIFAITTTDGTHYTVSIDVNCAINYGYILNNPFPDIIDKAGLVSIVGASGLHINTNLDMGGNIDGDGGLAIGKSAGFLADGLGPTFNILRSTNTLPHTYGFQMYSEIADASIPGATHIAVMQLNGGGFTPALAASYTNPNGRWYQLNAIPGNADPAVHPLGIPVLGDLPQHGTFNVTDSNGNSWILSCITLYGPFPSKVLQIKGFCSSFPYIGGTTNADINLVTAGITFSSSSGIAATVSGNATTSPTTFDVFPSAGHISISASTTGGSGVIGNFNFTLDVY